MVESNNYFVNEGLPGFAGEDPFGWIINAERFFQEQKIHSSDKVQWAFMRMEGVAMSWFHDWCQEDLDADWGTFAIAMIRKFRKTHDAKTLGEMKKNEEKPKGREIEGQTVEIYSEQMKRPEKMQEPPTTEEITPNMGIAGREEMKVSDVWVSHSLIDRGTEVSVEERRKMQVAWVEPPPPPEPPDTGALVAKRRDSGPHATALLEPKPPDTGQLEATLPRRVPPSKPPDMHVFVEEEASSNTTLCVALEEIQVPQRLVSPTLLAGTAVAIGGCPSTRWQSLVRVEVAVIGNGDGRNEKGVELVFERLSTTLDLMGQAHSGNSSSTTESRILGATITSSVPLNSELGFLIFVSCEFPDTKLQRLKSDGILAACLFNTISDASSMRVQVGMLGEKLVPVRAHLRNMIIMLQFCKESPLRQNFQTPENKCQVSLNVIDNIETFVADIISGRREAKLPQLSQLMPPVNKLEDLHEHIALEIIQFIAQALAAEMMVLPPSQLLALIDSIGSVVCGSLSAFLAYVFSAAFNTYYSPDHIHMIQAIEKYCYLLIGLSSTALLFNTWQHLLWGIVGENMTKCGRALLDGQSGSKKISSSNNSVAQLKEKLSSHIAYRCKSDSFNKCCKHPYVINPSLQNLLLNGLEAVEYLDVGIEVSGKPRWLASMLTELRKNGFKVLVLFQSIGGFERGTIGDIVDQFLRRKFGLDSYERVDKGLLPSKMHAALKKFNSQNNGGFVFLLKTCACLPNIKLSSIDTTVIFDSDWNPFVLANDIANDVFMVLGLVVDAESDILDASNEFALVLAQAVTVEVVAPLNLEETLSMLPPKCSGSEAMWVARSLVIGSSSSQQWDPGKKDLVFQLLLQKKSFGQLCGGTQEVFNLPEIVLQLCFILVRSIWIQKSVSLSQP